MKHCLLLLLGWLSASAFAADQPVPSAAESALGTNAAAVLKSPIEIKSRSSEVNLRSNVVVYIGDVRVTEDTMRLTCEYLIAIRPQRGGRIESITALTNVVMELTDEKGDKVHGTGEKLLYSYRISETETNEVIELSGSPLIETAQGKTRADIITYDRITGVVRLQNPLMTIEQEGTLTNFLSNPLNRTNSPGRKP